MAHPTVTVLTSVFNAAQFLKESVDSILGQTERNIELLVMDDGSTDECWEILTSFEDPRLRLWRQTNAGKAAALNTLLRHARAEYVAIHDADDVSCPTRLEKLLRRITSDPSLGAVFSGHSMILGGRVVAPIAWARTPKECARAIRAYQMPAHDATMLCRTDIVQNEGYDPELRVGQGLDLILRIGEHHRLEVIGESLYWYRIHAGSLTHAHAGVRRDGIRRAVDKARVRRGLPVLNNMEFERRYGTALNDRTHDVASHFMYSVYAQRRARQWTGAARTALIAAGTRPTDPRFLKPLAYAVSPLFAIEWWRRRRLSESIPERT